MAEPCHAQAGVRDAVCFRHRLLSGPGGRNQLCHPAIAEKLLDTARYYHDLGRWHVWLWLLMPDHVHGLVGCSRFESLSRIVAAWKRHTARYVDVEWQRGFFDHRLRNDEGFQEKADYISMNPVRKGLVAVPENWPYVIGRLTQNSSGRLGEASLPA